MKDDLTHDFIVIGGGILGMSTAQTLHRRYPGASILVLDKESGPAKHQTGRNSGVIHAGVYYKPGSLKARFCKEGNVATKAFCREHDIPFDECGKLIVATDARELERMHALVARCAENGIAIEVLDGGELRRREPNIVGVGAIFVPSTGIVSYTRITARMGDLVEAGGGRVIFGQEVVGIEESADGIRVRTGTTMHAGRYLVACGGLQSDRIVTMLGLKPDFQIIPFRGEYYLLAEKHNRIVNHLIYPVPDPTLPFLGVHLTRMINGTVTVGPNAVLAWRREGYRKTDISFGDSFRMLTYPGFRKAIWKHLSASVTELRNSISKTGYLRLVQKYCPSLVKADLLFYPAGIRAQAVSRSGDVIDDFLFMSTQRALVVCNAPSPAATSSIPIGNHIVDKLTELLAH
jgi:L-2-hydroxyglutarate oxidase